jgi:DNA-binding protein H-NS
MDRQRLEDWSIDELWALHADVDAVLTARLIAQKNELENRLPKLEPLLPQVGQRY